MISHLNWTLTFWILGLQREFNIEYVSYWNKWNFQRFLLFSSVQHPQTNVNLSSDVSLLTSHHQDGKSLWRISRFSAAEEQLTPIPIVSCTYLISTSNCTWIWLVFNFSMEIKGVALNSTSNIIKNFPLQYLSHHSSSSISYLLVMEVSVSYHGIPASIHVAMNSIQGKKQDKLHQFGNVSDLHLKFLCLTATSEFTVKRSLI